MMKTVLITGGSKGIGAATVLKFASQGWNTVFSFHSGGRQAIALTEKIIHAGGSCATWYCDVSDETSVRKFFASAEARYGTIDVLVNNAGVAYTGLFQEMRTDLMRSVFDVNVMGTLYCTRAALPGMLFRHSGSIINISSVWGITGASCEVVYSASKAAVIGFTKALAKELGPSGIRVNCVAPGATNTDMLSDLDEEGRSSLCEQTPLGRMGSPQEIAESIYFLATDPSAFITGQILSPNGGLVI